MSTQPTAPLEVVHAFMDAMMAKDYDTGLKYVADNCEYTNGPTGTTYGPAGVRGVLEPFFAPIEENQFIVHREAVNGAIVFLERLDRHRYPGGWVELPVNGVFEVHDGKITVWHELFDMATIVNAIGALPS